MKRKIMEKPKIALLPLYLRLYVDNFPEASVSVKNFLEKVSKCFLKKGIEVQKAKICCTENQFREQLEKIKKII